MTNPRTAFITGATSGFGAAAARRFVADGWRVVATGRRADRLQALVDALGADNVHAAAFDMRDEAAMRAAIEALPPAFRDIDLLVNNAGLAQGTLPAQRALLSDWQTMIDTNIRALVAVTHALLPTLIERRGAIINVSSTAANYPYTGGNVYGGSKAFVSQFSLGLRADLHGTGVRVTCIEPGLVGGTEFSLVRFEGDAERAGSVYAGAQPLTADDVAESVVWAASLPAHVNVNTIELMPVGQAFGALPVERAGD
jgi:serine 3-dehydrogenase